jgi:hypothetical protein
MIKLKTINKKKKNFKSTGVGDPMRGFANWDHTFFFFNFSSLVDSSTPIFFFLV